MGIEVSGQVIQGSVFHAAVRGSDFITGGKFGMEGSVLTTVAMVIGRAAVYLMYKNKSEDKTMENPPE